MKASDLGFCTPSRTRTGNPLKTAGQILASLGVVLIRPLACMFAGRSALALDLCFGRFRADRGGVNRGRNAARRHNLAQVQPRVRTSAGIHGSSSWSISDSPQVAGTGAMLFQLAASAGGVAQDGGPG